MINYFKNIQKRLDSQKTLKLVYDLSRNEKDKPKALEICQRLVSEYPYDMQIRRTLASLKEEMGLPISLPSIGQKISPSAFDYLNKESEL
jgi:hypothetical protein